MWAEDDVLKDRSESRRCVNKTCNVTKGNISCDTLNVTMVGTEHVDNIGREDEYNENCVDVEVIEIY